LACDDERGEFLPCCGKYEVRESKKITMKRGKRRVKRCGHGALEKRREAW
jgi:hypothetical protein